MPLPILEINALLAEPFLRTEIQEVHWVSCCSALKKLVRNQVWTCDSQQPGTGYQKFGLAHSESQLIEPQINQIQNAYPCALLRLSFSGRNLKF